MTEADRKKTYRTANVVLAFTLFVAVNVCAALYGGEAVLDLTQNRLYTLSPVTRATVRKIAEPLEVTVYRSENLTGIEAEYADVASRLLRRYAALSRGMMRLKCVSVAPYAAVEDEALSEGLDNMDDRANGGFSFFGLTMTVPSGRKRVIPAMAARNHRFLEYRLTKNIDDLAALKRPVLGVVSTRPEFSGWPIVDRLRGMFDVRFISRNALIFPDVDALMLVNPAKLSESTLYAVDQYLMSGGRVAVFDDGSGDVAEQKLFNRFLKPWGVTAHQSNGVKNDVPDTAQNDVVFYGVGRVVLPSAGRWSVVPEEKVTAEPLLLYAGENDVLGVRLTGRPQSAFDAAPNQNALVEKPNERLTRARRDAVLILIADSDVLQDEDETDNGLFVTNVLETLAKKAAGVPVADVLVWRRSFSERHDNKTTDSLRRERDAARTAMLTAERVLYKIKAREGIVPADERERAVSDRRVLERRLLTLRADFRAASGRLDAFERQQKKAFFALNVLFAPFVLGVLILALAFLRFCRRKGE